MFARPGLPALLPLLFVVAQAAQHPVPEPTAEPSPGTIELQDQEVAIPLSFIHNRPIVEVMIDGKGPYKMILDTGAAGSVLDLGLAEDLALPVVGEARLGSPVGGEPVPAKVVGFRSLSLGRALVHDGVMKAIALKGFFEQGDGPRGVLSSALFSAYLVTLDYPGKRLVLRAGSLPEPDGVEVIAYEEIGGLPAVPVTLAGTTIMVHMDTGSPGALMLPVRYADELPLSSPPEVVGKARAVSRELTVSRAPLDGTLTFGRLSINNPDIGFMDVPDVGNVGYELLGRFAITLDMTHHRVRLDGPALGVVSPKAQSPKRYGFAMRGAGEGEPEVAMVVPGSPAEQAGLKVGDRIVRIAGKQPADLTQDEIASIMRNPQVTLIVKRGEQVLEIPMSLQP